MRPTYDQEKQMVADAVAQLPSEFELRAFPNMRFRPMLDCSYYSESRKEVLVYIGVVQDADVLAFDKDTVEAIRREITK